MRRRYAVPACVKAREEWADEVSVCPGNQNNIQHTSTVQIALGTHLLFLKQGLAVQDLVGGWCLFLFLSPYRKSLWQGMA